MIYFTGLQLYFFSVFNIPLMIVMSAVLSQIVAALQQCIHYYDSCEPVRDETAEVIHSMEHQHIGKLNFHLHWYFSILFK